NATEAEMVRNAVMDRLTDENRRPVLLVQPLDAGRQIHAVAENRVLHPLRRTDIPDDGIADVNTDADGERLQPLICKLVAEGIARCPRRQGSAAGPLHMIELR